MKLNFNSEQRKHHAVTLRTIAVGLLLPAVLNALEIGKLDIPHGIMLIMFIGAGVFECLALFMLSPLNDEPQQGDDNDRRKR